MDACRTDSKKYCMACRHYDYCDRANRCNGDCGNCDVTDCENNPLKEAENDE